MRLRVCLTHSFPVKNIEADIGKKDISKEQYDFINRYLCDLEYDDYDKLIILCDALADANGFCILEKRFRFPLTAGIKLMHTKSTLKK